MDNNNYIIYFLLKGLGVILIITGIIGLFLPVLQGIAMILAGIALLKCKSFTQCMKKFKKQFQRWRNKRQDK